MIVKDSMDVVSNGDKEITVVVNDSTIALDVLVIRLLSSEFVAKPSFALLVGSGSEEWTKDKWIESAEINNLMIMVILKT